MDTITSKISDTTTVMQNYTICITLPIRLRANLKPKDKVILSAYQNGEITITKAPQKLEDWVGHGKEVFKALGGGENFIKKERKSWKN